MILAFITGGVVGCVGTLAGLYLFARSAIRRSIGH